VIAADTRILIAARQTNQAVGQSTGIAIDGKFGIPTAEDNPASRHAHKHAHKVVETKRENVSQGVQQRAPHPREGLACNRLPTTTTTTRVRTVHTPSHSLHTGRPHRIYTTTASYKPHTRLPRSRRTDPFHRNSDSKRRRSDRRREFRDWLETRGTSGRRHK
jgi:hypothetical protein